MKNTVLTFKEAKKRNEKLTLLTAYDYTTAKIIDSSGVNGILVGDSLGTVALGYENTLSVTMDDMIHHSRAVSRAVKNSLLITDMPFMSYQTSTYDAIKNAGRLVKEGFCNAVKLEGGSDVIDSIKGIVKAQIPVMGHLGLTPQSINKFGGYKVQGKNDSEIKSLIEDAKRLEDAGVFSIVLECIPLEVTKLIDEAISIPTIGIGSGMNTTGQILVYSDMLGMFKDFKAKFVKYYANLDASMNLAIQNYIKDVNEENFPLIEHSYSLSEINYDISEGFYGSNNNN
ncbi:3-methyl-2-oxobutanoate hydroxymethyltransferase [Clostridium cylindrosporum]|uniref:3-methyl-2-oxobutanoate hydroxymethyltransferase n=1 Tax=Clostridium cylindrosporum DSM 605 TaxID=1121307 RepID=A0A0J8D999_CLOCY|nr:3-methyl-2-oxobutanoate hydroxymethyltransferase [Clostridium cylindrosporum]KMT20909.1 3-methyl-2-oxobutanoate hydroxymethyltransferase PanB [Clostridium cylindrosporum DSM 605]